jgi:hypothetical protein
MFAVWLFSFQLKMHWKWKERFGWIKYGLVTISILAKDNAKAACNSITGVEGNLFTRQQDQALVNRALMEDTKLLRLSGPWNCWTDQTWTWHWKSSGMCHEHNHHSIVSHKPLLISYLKTLTRTDTQGLNSITGVSAAWTPYTLSGQDNGSLNMQG